jgi:hypothetical protein
LRAEDFSNSSLLTLWAERGETSDTIASHKNRGRKNVFINYWYNASARNTLAIKEENEIHFSMRNIRMPKLTLLSRPPTGRSTP